MTTSIRRVNKAMMRPALVAGVEKRLMVLNGLLSFSLIAASHLQFPVFLIGVGFFILLHIGLRFVSKRDPYIGLLFKRSTRYSWQSYFPAKSHPLAMKLWMIKTVSRPR